MSEAQPARAKTAAKKAPKVTRIKNAKPAPTPNVDEKALLKANADKEKALAAAKAEKQLTPLAQEITHRLEQSTLLGTKAVDHRVAAAIRMGEARAICEEGGISFKAWAEKHIPNQSYETIRKLASAGASGNADEARLQIADMRERNAKANKKLRKAKKRAGAAQELPTPKGSGRAESPFQKVEHGLSQMKETEVKELLASTAAEMGMQLVSDKEVKALKAAADSGSAAPAKKGEPKWKPLLDGVLALRGSERVDFLFELQEATGYALMPKDDKKRLAAYDAAAEKAAAAPAAE